MTEPKPEYDVKESDVLSGCRKLLRTSGWFVLSTSQDRATRKQMSGLTDLIAVRYNCTLFVEGKRPGGKLRHSQKRFRDRILPHTGPNLHYLVVDDVDSLAYALSLLGL